MKYGNKAQLPLALLCLLPLAFAGCAGEKAASSAPAKDSWTPPVIHTKEALAKAKDGTFEGKSKPTERGDYTILSITVKDHKITAAAYEGYKKDGTLKDETYGKTKGEEENKAFYNKAQLAVAANHKYAEALLQMQEVNKVDGISGATVSYRQFFDAAAAALAEADR